MNHKKNINTIKKKNIFSTSETIANGSLGLLALGAVGIKAWRKKREEEELKLKNNQKNG
jgi:hypothetical protein